MAPLQQTLLWDWEFLMLPHPPQVFIARGFEALFPALEPWVVWSHSPVVPPSWCQCGTTWSTSFCFIHPACQLPPRSPSCPSPSLLPAWMNVSLTPWLLDFHAVWFSGSSGWFLFLNWLLSFFFCVWGVTRIYLHLHLGQKPEYFYSCRTCPWTVLVCTVSKHVRLHTVQA